MIEKQFIQFSDSIEENDAPLIPLVLDGNGIELYTDIDLTTAAPNTSVAISLVDAAGVYTYLSTSLTSPTTSNLNMFGYASGLFIHSAMVAAMSLHTTFRIKYVIQHYESHHQSQPILVTRTKYSNLIIIESNNYGELMHIRYKCNETTAGFPFNGSEYVSAYVPICLRSPQWQQDEEVYTKLNGAKVVLFAANTKEYEAHTDYITEDWHDKLLTALSCDQVKLNGVEYHKSDKYDIDWDNAIKMSERGGEKLAMATFKMIACSLVRNSN